MTRPPSPADDEATPPAPSTPDQGTGIPRGGEGARRDPILVGWREWVAFPELGIPRIKAKVDTGARSSALHAHEIRYVRKGGRRYVRFKVYPTQKDDRSFVEARGEWLEERTVRSSFGWVEVRPVILTQLELGGEQWPIEVTLTRRDSMGFRLLLGRQALKGRCRVDPGASFLTRRTKR